VQEDQERQEARCLRQEGEEAVRGQALSRNRLAARPGRSAAALGRISAALLALGALGLGACGDDDEKPATQSAAADATLTGTQWTLDTAELGVSGADQVTAWIEFDKARVTGNDGCNQFTGTYTASGSKLKLGPLAGTQKACVGAAGEVANRVQAALGRVAAYEISAKTLRLEGAGGEELLVYNATVPSPEGKWEVLSVLYDDAIRSVIIGSSLTADFTADGKVSGQSGCNSFSGEYETSGTQIRIGPLAATQRACAEEEVNKQEQGYLAALESARSFEQTGTQMTLLNAKGQMAITLQRAG
jgi:heat shock protein HslJ